MCIYIYVNVYIVLMIIYKLEWKLLVFGSIFCILVFSIFMFKFDDGYKNFY